MVAFDTGPLARSELGCLPATFVRGQCRRRYSRLDHCRPDHAKLTGKGSVVRRARQYLSIKELEAFVAAVEAGSVRRAD
jgi:hypothetical protein